MQVPIQFYLICINYIYFTVIYTNIYIKKKKKLFNNETFLLTFLFYKKKKKVFKYILNVNYFFYLLFYLIILTMHILMTNTTLPFCTQLFPVSFQLSLLIEST